MDPLTIVVSFDVGEQVMPGSIPGWITSLVHEFGFDRAKAAFHRGIDAPISVKWLSKSKATIVERRINSRRSRGPRSA
jgi:hypothetical protein